MAQAASPSKSNGFDADKLQGYIGRIEDIETEISSTMGAAMRECKTLRDDIRDVVTEAKDAGIPVKALKAELKLRALDRDKAKIVARLDQEDEQSLEAIQSALGEFA